MVPLQNNPGDFQNLNQTANFVLCSQKILRLEREGWEALLHLLKNEVLSLNCEKIEFYVDPKMSIEKFKACKIKAF